MNDSFIIFPDFLNFTIEANVAISTSKSLISTQELQELLHLISQRDASKKITQDILNKQSALQEVISGKIASIVEKERKASYGKYFFDAAIIAIRKTLQRLNVTPTLQEIRDPEWKEQIKREIYPKLSRFTPLTHAEIIHDLCEKNDELSNFKVENLPLYEKIVALTNKELNLLVKGEKKSIITALFSHDLLWEAVNIMNQELMKRRTFAALKITSFIRAFLVTKSASVTKAQDQSAITIQKVMRGTLGKTEVKNLRHERKEVSATNIQKIARSCKKKIVVLNSRCPDAIE